MSAGGAGADLQLFSHRLQCSWLAMHMPHVQSEWTTCLPEQLQRHDDRRIREWGPQHGIKKPSQRCNTWEQQSSCANHDKKKDFPGTVMSDITLNTSVENTEWFPCKYSPSIQRTMSCLWQTRKRPGLLPLFKTTNLKHSTFNAFFFTCTTTNISQPVAWVYGGLRVYRRSW